MQAGRRIRILAGIIAVTGCWCRGGFVFQPAQTTTLPTGRPWDIVSADFNGDGRKDIAVIDTIYQKLWTALGTGSGTFGTPVSAASINYPSALAAADLNGDGLSDLVVIGETNNVANVLMRNQNGTFSAGTPFGTNLRSPILGDVNGDGRPDLVTTSSSQVRIQLNLGSGNFGAANEYYCADNPVSIALADMNHDGHLDVIATDGTMNAVVTLMGRGDGTLEPARSYRSTLVTPHHPAVADFDRDGKLDVAVATGGTNDIEIHFGTGDGGLDRRTSIYLGGDPRRLEVGDFNADGMDDIVALDIKTGVLKFLAGRGDGTFADPDLYTAPRGIAAPDMLLVDDFNADTIPDVLTLSRPGTVGVMTGAPEPSVLLWFGLLVLCGRRSRARVPRVSP